MSINSEHDNQCVAILKRQNAISIPKRTISEYADEELCAFLEKIIEEQPLREQELIRIKQLKKDINENKLKFSIVLK